MSVVNKIILGTVQMGLPYGINNSVGKLSVEDSFSILKEAYSQGIRVLDTAEAYGSAHTVIGEFHRLNPGYAFKIITKIPTITAFDDIQQKITKYLVDLNVEQLECLMFHSFETYKKFKVAAIPVLLGLKKEGAFLHLGVSIYTNAELEEVINDENVEVIQLPFNLLDNAAVRGDLLMLAKKKHKIIHTRSVYLQGLFFKSLEDQNAVVQNLQPQLKAIHDITTIDAIAIEDLALSYCLHQEYIDCVLIGVDSIKQLQENLISANYQLQEKIVNKINRITTDNLRLLNPSLWK